MTTESSAEQKLTLSGGDCSVTIEGQDDRVDWSAVLKGAYSTWLAMHKAVHEARLEEIRAEQNAKPGPASAGFIQEPASEARNQTLAGGTGARPV